MRGKLETDIKKFETQLREVKSAENGTSRPIKNASEISRSGQTFPRAPFTPAFTKNHSILLTQKLGRKIRDAFSFLFDPMDWLLPGIKQLQAMFIFQTEQKFPWGTTPLYKLYRYVPPHQVGFSRRFGLKRGIHFAKFGLESGMVFEGNYGSA